MNDVLDSGDQDAQIYERFNRIAEAVATAAGRSGRAADEIRIVAVSKKMPPETVCAAAEAGLSVFGESRVQEAFEKIPRCPSRLEWHFVGHLQSNKVRPAVELFHRLHSIDSESLLSRINAVAEEAGVRLPVLLQVNVAGESQKFGLSPEDVLPVLERSMAYNAVEVDGLMTIPPFHEDSEKSRPHFSRLRLLRDDLVLKTGVSLPHLSMGMSGDFAIAIEEGATLVRIGTGLFGDRKG